jgi:hypothetical protein
MSRTNESPELIGPFAIIGVPPRLTVTSCAVESLLVITIFVTTAVVADGIVYRIVSVTEALPL